MGTLEISERTKTTCQPLAIKSFHLFVTRSFGNSEVEEVSGQRFPSLLDSQRYDTPPEKLKRRRSFSPSVAIGDAEVYVELAIILRTRI